MFQVGKYVMMTPSKGLLCIQLIVCPEAAARLRLGDDRRRRGCDGRPRLPRTAGRGGRGGPPSTWCHDDGRDWRRDLPGPLVSNEGNYRIVQIEIFSKGLITRTLSKRSNKISRRHWSRRMQIVLMSYIYIYTYIFDDKMILNGSSCILGILLSIQSRVLRKCKHRSRCDCTCTT